MSWLQIVLARSREFKEAEVATSLNNALIVSVAVSLLWTLPASAQRRTNRDVGYPSTANQVVNFADARIATLKADLRLTPDEEKNWSGFQAALHDIAVQRADEMTNPRTGRSNAAPASPSANSAQPNNPPATGNAENDTAAPNPPNDTAVAAGQEGSPDEIQALRNQADALNRRADELKKIANAAQPLYASLNDSQRKQLMTFIRTNGAQDQATPNEARRHR
jgi:hypothetical protein